MSTVDEILESGATRPVPPPAQRGDKVSEVGALAEDVERPEDPGRATPRGPDWTSVSKARGDRLSAVDAVSEDGGRDQW